MQRSVLLLTPVWIAFSLCALQGAPARLPYERVSSEAAWFELAGTTWKGACYKIPCWITFERDGKLTYRTSPNDVNSSSPGMWRLTGNELFFEINQYSEHRGPVIGNVVQGDSLNKANMRDRFRLERIEPGQ